MLSANPPVISGKETFHALHTKTSEDLGQALSSALAVHTGAVGFESAKKARYQIWEVDFAESLHEGTESFRSGSTSFGDRVDEYNMNERQELVEVRDKVLGICEGCQVSHDLCSLLLRVCTTLAKTTLDYRDDLQ